MINEPRKNVSLVFIPICLLLLLLLVFSSEIIFMISSNSSQLNYFLLNRARHYATTNDFKKSFNYLNLLVKLNGNHNSRIYGKNQIALNYNLDTDSLLNTNSQFLEKYKDLLVSLNLQHVIKNTDSVSKIFYEMGVTAYLNKDSQLTPDLLQVAISIEPELSYYHIELANYYLLHNDVQSAKRAIDFCLRFKYPQRHCQDYSLTHIEKGLSEEPGFLEEEMGQYFSDLIR